MRDELSETSLAGSGSPREDEELRGVLAEWKQSIHNTAARPEGFWRSQQRAITARRRGVTRPRLVWATAMAVLVLTATWLERTAPLQTAAAQTDPDQVLLVNIERSVRREVPRALEPASLLTDEMGRAAQTQLQRNP